MFKASDFLLLVVLGYVGYKMAYMDGLTAVNLFILLCIVVAIISTIIRRVDDRKGRKRKGEGK